MDGHISRAQLDEKTLKGIQCIDPAMVEKSQSSQSAEALALDALRIELQVANG
jgi:hypothetical protein